jgi:hypothetical protein
MKISPHLKIEPGLTLMSGAIVRAAKLQLQLRLRCVSVPKMGPAVSAIRLRFQGMQSSG